MSTNCISGTSITGSESIDVFDAINPFDTDSDIEKQLQARIARLPPEIRAYVQSVAPPLLQPYNDPTPASLAVQVAMKDSWMIITHIAWATVFSYAIVAATLGNTIQTLGWTAFFFG